MTDKNYDALVSRTPGPDHMLWGKYQGRLRFADRCETCEGRGIHKGKEIDAPHRVEVGLPAELDEDGISKQERAHCIPCGGLGWEVVTASLPTLAPPGSAEKQMVLAVRYAAGIPLWNVEDARVDAYNPEAQRAVGYVWTRLKEHMQGENPLVTDLSPECGDEECDL